MNTLSIISTIISAVCVIIMTILAWVTISKVSETRVSFVGTPVDKKEFDKHCEDQKQLEFTTWKKMEEDARKHESAIGILGANVAGLRSATESNTEVLNRVEEQVTRLFDQKENRK